MSRASRYAALSLALSPLSGVACRVPPVDDDIRAVRAVAEGIVAADNARNLPGVLSFYADSAVLLPPGEPPKSGLAAIRPGYETLFQNFQPQLFSTIDEVVVDGSLAYVRGRMGGTFKSIGSMPSRSLSDVYLMVLARTDQGWKISRLIWHSTRPPERSVSSDAPVAESRQPNAAVGYGRHVNRMALPRTSAGTLR